MSHGAGGGGGSWVPAAAAAPSRPGGTDLRVPGGYGAMGGAWGASDPEPTSWCQARPDFPVGVVLALSNPPGEGLENKLNIFLSLECDSLGEGSPVSWSFLVPKTFQKDNFAHLPRGPFDFDYFRVTFWLFIVKHRLEDDRGARWAIGI